MNWTKAVIAGVVAGVVVWIADFVIHGMIMGATYTKYPEVFSQEQANPVLFLLISVCIALAVAILFAKTRDCWQEGIMGGVVFGFFLGLVAFFSNFYYPLVLDGFPYYLGWCWGGINMIEAVIGGTVVAAIYKQG